MASTAKVLEVVFETDTKKSVTLSISDPKDGLTKAEVTPVMQSIIDKKLIVNASGELASISKVQVRETTVTDLA